MALIPSHELLKDALPEAGEIPYEKFVQQMRESGKFRALDNLHDARRAGTVFTGFREGVFVISRFPIASEPRR
jgi:hypothetical protein